jgi:hypothetical protein
MNGMSRRRQTKKRLKNLKSILKHSQTLNNWQNWRNENIHIFHLSLFSLIFPTHFNFTVIEAEIYIQFEFEYGEKRKINTAIDWIINIGLINQTWMQTKYEKNI